MSLTHEFYMHLFKVCQNGCIPALKFNAALQSCHLTSNIYHTGQELAAWIIPSSAKLRQGASKFGDCAVDEEVKERCVRKALVLQSKIDWATLETLGVYRVLRVWGI